MQDYDIWNFILYGMMAWKMEFVVWDDEMKKCSLSLPNSILLVTWWYLKHQIKLHKNKKSDFNRCPKKEQRRSERDGGWWRHISRIRSRLWSRVWRWRFERINRPDCTGNTGPRTHRTNHITGGYIPSQERKYFGNRPKQTACWHSPPSPWDTDGKSQGK